MKNHLARSLAAGVLALSWLPTAARADGEFGVVTLGPADAQNCTATTLSSALDAAKRPEYLDEIWIARTAAPDFFDLDTIRIENRNIKIVGGFDDCEDITPSGYQVLDANGGDSESVFTIRGLSHVTLEHLDIRGGDEGAGDNGGAIDFDGHGTLHLSHVRINHNIAANGGGIYLNGSAATDLEFTVGDDVVISDNRAGQDGGGLYMTGSVVATALGSSFALHRNLASREGGGIFLQAPARLHIDATPFPNYPTFWKNNALRGGALVATGRGGENRPAQVRLQSRDGVTPVSFTDNRASESGGAIYLGANGAGSSGRVCADDTGFEANAAPNGAAIYAAKAGDYQGGFTMNACEGEASRCGPGARCSFFTGNRTETAAGEPTQGAVVHFTDGRGVLELNRTRFTENVAGSLIKMDESDGNELRLFSSLMHHNTLSSYVIDTAANSARIRHCTIADNALAGSFVLRIAESGRTGVPNRSSLTNSIIAQNGKNALRHEGYAAQTLIEHVRSSEISSLYTNGADRATVFIGFGGFRDYVDYVPDSRSKVLDLAPDAISDEAPDEAGRDLLYLPRTVDLGLNPDETRLRDLGCCEMQAFDYETVFSNGFE